MGKSCNTHGEAEESIQYFGPKARRKDITGKKDLKEIV
jgi:hypothetical protein